MVPTRQTGSRAVLGFCSLVLTFLLMGGATGRQNGPLDIGSKRELFIDTHLIEAMSGVRLEMHSPMPKEIVMHLDKLWEGNGCNYYSIFQDGNIYRMYYDAWAHEPSSIPVHEVFIGYAESEDGKTWVRPELGLFEFNGSKKNNIVWASPKLDNWGSRSRTPIPAVPADARYKAFYNGNGGLMAAKSADGIHWSRITDRTRFDRWCLRQPQSGLLGRGARSSTGPTIEISGGRTVPPDLVLAAFGTSRPPPPTISSTGRKGNGWSIRVRRTRNSTPTTSFPYYRAPHIYLGFPARYLDRGWSELR